MEQKGGGEQREKRPKSARQHFVLSTRDPLFFLVLLLLKLKKEPFGIQFLPTVSNPFDPPRYLIRLYVQLGAHMREEPVPTPWCSNSFLGRFSS